MAVRFQYKATWTDLYKSRYSSGYDYYQWCVENLGEEDVTWDYDIHPAEGLSFKNKEDFVAFKLRWFYE